MLDYTAMPAGGYVVRRCIPPRLPRAIYTFHRIFDIKIYTFQ